MSFKPCLFLVLFLLIFLPELGEELVVEWVEVRAGVEAAQPSQTTRRPRTVEEHLRRGDLAQITLTQHGWQARFEAKDSHNLSHSKDLGDDRDPTQRSRGRQASGGEVNICHARSTTVVCAAISRNSRRCRRCNTCLSLSRSSALGRGMVCPGLGKESGRGRAAGLMHWLCQVCRVECVA